MLTGKQLDPVTVTLIESTDPGKPNSFWVDNPMLTIHAGDELEFNFIGCKNPTIMIPVDGVMEERIIVPDPREPGTIRMRVRRDPNLAQPTFAYAIYSSEIDDFAEGNSPPRMVIDKRP